MTQEQAQKLFADILHVFEEFEVRPVFSALLNSFVLAYLGPELYVQVNDWFFLASEERRALSTSQLRKILAQEKFEDLTMLNLRRLENAFNPLFQELEKKHRSIGIRAAPYPVTPR